MIVLITDTARPLSRSPQFFEAADHELANAARGCAAYSGRWRIQGNDVGHDVEQSLFPNWAGTSLVRSLEMDRNRLALATAEFSIRSATYTATRVWERSNGHFSSL